MEPFHPALGEPGLSLGGPGAGLTDHHDIAVHGTQCMQRAVQIVWDVDRPVDVGGLELGRRPHVEQADAPSLVKPVSWLGRRHRRRPNVCR